MKSAIAEQVVDLLFFMHKRSEEYRAANKMLAELQGDFSTTVRPIDDEIDTRLFALLDEILGDNDLASYIYYECLCSSGGGKIIVNRKEYLMQTKEQIMAYINREGE